MSKKTTTYGKQPAKAPKGMGAEIHFPVLAVMDTQTGDHRLLDSNGYGIRDLPLSIRGQFTDSYGHDGAFVTGALYEVTFDVETNKISGKGFLLDDDNGWKHALYVQTGAMRGNSIDLTEAKARFEEDLDSGDYRVRFTNWKIGATTGVGKPAFAEAYATIPNEDAVREIKASFASGDLGPLVCDVEDFTFQLVVQPATDDIPDEVLAAAGGVTVPYEKFFRPESERPQKIVVDAEGNVYGHLGLWESCHDGIEGQCIRIPRPTDAYASFNKPGVLTDRGIVNTGPIFLAGGHRPGKGVRDLEAAYGGVENSWADVRITEGRLGPWISGVVRPGVDDTKVYTARASRISGHWVGGKLKAIVSVNAEGYDVPGSDDLIDDLVAGFAFGVTDGGVSELIAGFPSCVQSAEPPAIAPPAPEPAPVVPADEFRSADDLLLAALIDEDDELVDA